MGDTFERKVIFLGQSGAGKSTLLNAVYNDNVFRENLSGPARVDMTAVGVTSEIANYIMVHGTFLTDTVGFDDNRFDPHRLAHEMRLVLRASRVGFTHIVLCLPLGRVSNGTRVYLEMMSRIFGEAFMDHLVIYVSRCDDGTTARQFIEANKTDVDLGPKLIKLSDGGVDTSRIIAGSMMFHRNQDRDAACLPDRQQTFKKLNEFLTKRFDPLDPPSDCSSEAIMDFIKYVMHRIFNVKESLQSVLKTLAECQDIKVRNFFPECCVCLSADYNDGDSTPVRLSCHHIFHFGCCKRVIDEAGRHMSCLGIEQIECPLCRRFVNFPGEKLDS